VLSPEREDYLRTRIAHRLGFRAAPVCTCEIDSRRLARCGNCLRLNVTLDGYIAATGDDIGWSGGDAGAHGGPSDELFQWWLARTGERPVAVRAQAVGDDELLLADRRPAAQRYPGGDRVRAELAGHAEGGVLSTIDKVDWNTRLVTGDAVAEITRLRARTRPDGHRRRNARRGGHAAGLIDEYALATYPVLVAAARRSSPHWTAG